MFTVLKKYCAWIFIVAKKCGIEYPTELEEIMRKILEMAICLSCPDANISHL